MPTYRFVFILCCIALVQCERKFKGKAIPSYIIPCNASVPDFSKCALLHGKQAIPALLKGDPKFKLQPLVPFHLDKVVLDPTPNLKLSLSNVELYGLDTIDLKDAVYDIKNKHIKIVLTAKSLDISSNYKMNGQILVLPISGEGPAKLEFGDSIFEYSLDYDLIKKGDGKTYFDNLRPKVDFKVGKPYFQFDNLFNGNKELGENTNKVLNENSQEVIKDFGLAISEIVKAIATGIVKSYVSTIPYDELILQ